MIVQQTDTRWCNSCHRTLDAAELAEDAPCPRCGAGSYQLWKWDLVRTLCTCPIHVPEEPIHGREYALEKGACAQVFVPAQCTCPKRRVGGVGLPGCAELKEKGLAPRCGTEHRRVRSTMSGGLEVGSDDSEADAE
jgi:predicted RNA-binding Zn-ribbon protein involved in translation (DUF1610 family)